MNSNYNNLKNFKRDHKSLNSVWNNAKFMMLRNDHNKIFNKYL